MQLSAYARAVLAAAGSELIGVRHNVIYGVRVQLVASIDAVAWTANTSPVLFFCSWLLTHSCRGSISNFPSPDTTKMDNLRGTTARLRRTFQYPDDETTTSDSPEAMDEEGPYYT